MRTILLFALLAVVAVSSIYAQSDSEDYKKNAKAVLKKCVGEEGAGEEDVKALQDKQFPSSQKGKCVLACMLETAGILKDNKYDPEGVYAMLDKYVSKNAEKKAAGKAAADDCAKEVESYNGKDRCELAVKTIACFRTKAPSLDISPE